ncbi:MAG: hypothetical protein IJG16_01550, partial [Clostridia bacterium]|nr:hypothetical protein [Clostridia bacterium]
IVNAILNAILLRRKYPDLTSNVGIGEILKSVAATAVMAAVVIALYNIFMLRFDGVLGSIILAAICGGVGVIAYVLMLLLTGSKDIKKLLKFKK